MEDISTWGTLRTTDFPQPYGFNEDCWCRLSADNNQRIVLSVISFQLYPYDPTCLETGLYLQSERNRSKDCTFLQHGHYYISSSKHLYLNFYSRKPAIRAGFWIIYEASDGKSRIRLKCGDTDEVRPAFFTRFSTKKELILTPYIYEFASSTTPNLDLHTTTKLSSTTLPFATNTIDLFSEKLKNSSTFLQTKLSRYYFTEKWNEITSTKKIFETSTTKRTTTTLASKTTTTAATTTITTITTTNATKTTSTTNSNISYKTSTIFKTLASVISNSWPKTTRKIKKSTILNKILNAKYLKPVTSENLTTFINAKIMSTVNEFIISTTPQIQSTNVVLSDFGVEKINFDKENSTLEKNEFGTITKSNYIFPSFFSKKFFFKFLI